MPPNDMPEPPTDFGNTPQFDYIQTLQFSHRLPFAEDGPALRGVRRHVFVAIITKYLGTLSLTGVTAGDAFVFGFPKTARIILLKNLFLYTRL